MRIPFFAAALTLTCATAFAQGKVTFGNDSNHLLVFTTYPVIHGAGGDFSAFAGLPVPQLGTTNDQMQFFTAQLWAGTSSSSLSLQTSIPAGRVGFADGRLANVPIALTGIPPGSPAFFQLLVFETAGGSFLSAWASGYVTGTSPLFQTTAGTIVPNPIVSPINPSFSTWAPGPIVLGWIPEPSTAALLGLGALAFMLSRRRTKNAAEMTRF